MASENPLAAITERLREIARKREAEKKQPTYGKPVWWNTFHPNEEWKPEHATHTKPTKPLGQRSKHSRRDSSLH